MNRIPLPARVFAATAASAAAAAAMLLSAPALAAVTAEEAARLKTTLTPLGAERGANKDGSIPAWDGGMTKAPAGFKAGDAVRVMAAELGGKGGGKPDLAQAGGTDASKLPQAFDKLVAMVRGA